MAEQMNIYQKLAKIRKHVEVMKRDTKAYGYSYKRVFLPKSRSLWRNTISL